MLDHVSALVGFALFATFAGGLALAVADLPLTLITLIVILMAGFDLWRETKRG